MAKVALDKIQDEDFIVSADPGKVFKNYGGANHILFFISDNEKENPYAPYDAYSSNKTVPGGGVLLAAMSGDRMFYTNHWSRWSGGSAWSKDKKGSDDQIGINHKYKGWDATGLSNGKRISEVADRVIVLNLDLVRQKYSTESLRSARAEAKAGATAFKSDKEFKDANKKRYHDILATKAASLPLDKMVEEAEKFKEEDEQIRKLQEARNKFENYLYQMKQTIEDDSLKSKLGDDYEKIKEKLTEAEGVLEVEKVSCEEYEQAQQELESFINPIMQNIVKEGGGEFAGEQGGAPPSPPQDVPSEPPIEEID